jgi:hypothetical protein
MTNVSRLEVLQYLCDFCLFVRGFQIPGVVSIVHSNCISNRHILTGFTILDTSFRRLEPDKAVKDGLHAELLNEAQVNANTEDFYANSSELKR